MYVFEIVCGLKCLNKQDNVHVTVSMTMHGNDLIRNVSV